jgi:hypothetical protein
MRAYPQANWPNNGRGIRRQINILCFILKKAVKRRKPFDTPAMQATQRERAVTQLLILRSY